MTDDPRLRQLAADQLASNPWLAAVRSQYGDLQPAPVANLSLTDAATDTVAKAGPGQPQPAVDGPVSGTIGPILGFGLPKESKTGQVILPNKPVQPTFDDALQQGFGVPGIGRKPEPAPSASPPAKPSPAPSAGQAGSKPAGPSLERQFLADEDRIREERSRILAGQEESVRKQQDILRTGEGLATDMLKQAGIDDAIHEAELNQLQSKALHDANTRDIEIQRQAELLRKEKVDPKHWYKETGTAGSILAAIAIGAGAFAAAMPHTGSHENHALSIINKAIDRDIAAQQDDLDRKWKDLNWQGQESDKQFVRDNWMVNQKNELKRTAYSNALAMVAQVRTSTNNQVAAQQLDGLATELAQKREDLKEESAKQRFSVSVLERQQQAAAAAANPFSAINTQKAYMLYRQKAESANLEHPDKPVPILSMQEWLPTYQGLGMQRPSASGGNGDNEKFEAGLQSTINKGRQAADVGPLTAAASLVPWLFQGQAIRKDRLDQYNSDMQVNLRLVGERMPGEDIEKRIRAYEISPFTPREQALARVQAYEEFMRANSNIVSGAKKSSGPETPPGATEVK